MLPTVLSCIKHPNAHVRLAASWTLGEIIKESTLVLNQDTTLPNIISAITFGLRDSNKRISHNACLVHTQLFIEEILIINCIAHRLLFVVQKSLNHLAPN
jgi:hypothetical protein